MEFLIRRMEKKLVEDKEPSKAAANAFVSSTSIVHSLTHSLSFEHEEVKTQSFHLFPSDSLFGTPALPLPPPPDTENCDLSSSRLLEMPRGTHTSSFTSDIPIPLTLLFPQARASRGARSLATFLRSPHHNPVTTKSEFSVLAVFVWTHSVEPQPQPRQ